MKIFLLVVLLGGLVGCAAPGPKLIDGMTLDEVINEPYTADQVSQEH